MSKTHPNIRIKAFEECHPTKLTESVNSWLDENRSKIEIQDIKEFSANNYTVIIIYYTPKEK